MVDKDEDAGQGSGPADGRRRRQPPTIDVKAVEMPVTDAASAGPSAEAAASVTAPRTARSRLPILVAGTLGAGLELKRRAAPDFFTAG